MKNISSIKYVSGHTLDIECVDLSSLHKRDTMLYVEIDGQDFFGVYGGIKIDNIGGKGRGYIPLNLNPPEPDFRRIEGHLTEDEDFMLDREVKAFQIMGSWTQEIIKKVKKDFIATKKNELLERFLASKKEAKV